MIIFTNQSGVFAVKQRDHAAFAGFMLEHWNDHGFQQIEQRDRIVKATIEHDDGWKEYDENPRIDGRSGLPVDFLHVTEEEAGRKWKS